MSPARRAVLASVRGMHGGGTGPVLSGLDLDILEREMLCVVGPPRCGKSTLLRMLAGLDRPAAGEITLRGRPVTGPSRRIGLMLQESTLLPWLTVRQNLWLPLRVGGREPCDPWRVDALLGTAGLLEIANLHPHALRPGTRRFVEFCRALVRDPALLLLDEPLGGLDELAREGLAEELDRMWQLSGKAAVVFTRNVADAVLLGDRVAVMSPRPSRIVEIVPVGLPRPRSASALLGSSDYLDLVRRIRAVLPVPPRPGQS